MLLGSAPVRGDAEQAPGGQQRDAGEQRALGEQVLEGEVLDQGLGIQLGPEGGMGEHRLDLRAEQEGPVAAGPVERLDAEAVPGQQQLAPLGVPERDREHPVQALERPLPPLREGAQHDLGVGARAEAVAGRLQLGAQLAEVVDLAVVGEDQAPVLGRHGLLAGGRQVDDREAPVAEADRPIAEVAFGVRPAVHQGVRHLTQDGQRDGVAVEVEDAGYSTHEPVPSLPREPPAR
jgi:hypothetical protein